MEGTEAEAAQHSPVLCREPCCSQQRGNSAEPHHKAKD